MDKSKSPSEPSGQQRQRPAPKSAALGKMLRLPGLEEYSGFSRSAIYRAMQEDGFPRPVKIGRRAVAWVTAEVEAWLDAKIAARGARAR